MKKVFSVFLIAIFMVLPLHVNANIVCNDGTVSPTCADCHRGCCSHHGGCSANSSNYNSSGNNHNTYKQNTYVVKKSSNTSVSSIVVNGYELNNVSDTNSVVVYSNTADVKVNLADSKSSYTLNGDNNIKLDEVNNFNINVIAEDGTSKTYLLEITRKIKKSDRELILYINGKRVKFNNNDVYNTSKKFKNNKVKLKCETSDGLSSVAIYRGNKQVGNTVKLKKGKNKLKFILTDLEGNQRKYKVNIKRNK